MEGDVREVKPAATARPVAMDAARLSRYMFVVPACSAIYLINHAVGGQQSQILVFCNNTTVRDSIHKFH